MKIISLPLSHQLSKKVFNIFVLSLLCAFTPHTTRAFEWNIIPKVMLATAGTYFASQVYVAYNLTSATNRYASVRYILSVHGHNQQNCLAELKKEILRKHYQMTHSYWPGKCTYAALPLVWYVNKLDSAIRSLTWISWFNIDCNRDKQITDLLHDLYTVRDYIVTDYDYIREQRIFLKTER